MMKAALTLLVLVAAVALLVRLLESSLAFFPVAGETVTPQQFGVRYDALSIPTIDGEQLHAWVLRASEGPADAGPYVPVPPRAQVLYFHGNGGNLSIWATVLAQIARHGYSVFAVDYRGYGNSTGRPTERGLYRDVDAVVERFWDRAEADQPVIYWGRSLGGAMAAYAATVRAPDGLILESAFPDVPTLLRRSPMAVLAFLSSYRFPAARFMQQVSAPVLVLHGDGDRVVPFEQGRMLFERIAGPKSFVTIRGGDHNDPTPRDPHVYWDAVNEFSAGL